MTSNVSINVEQKLFVIKNGAGYSCFGFDNAKNHSAQIAEMLGAKDLIPGADDYGTLAGYDKYQQAVVAWAASPKSNSTYFEPGTDPKVQKLLESYRRSGNLVRLFCGDPETGRDWMNEWDMVGRIGRSGGTMKVPLMISLEEDSDGFGGGAICTANVLRMMDVGSGKEVYRSERYQAPQIDVLPKVPQTDGYGWTALRDGKTEANFKTAFEAHEWAAYMRGEIAAKSEHLRLQLRRAA